jgi:hypothetical protein
MRDISPGLWGDGCSNLAKFSRGRNKNLPNIFPRHRELSFQVSFEAQKRPLGGEVRHD